MDLQGISEEVERLAKAEATRRGITLAEFVSHAIVTASRVSNAEFNFEKRIAPLAEERAWYQAHREEIARDYAGKMVAISKSAVIGSAKNTYEIANLARAKIGDRPVYVVDLRDPRERYRWNEQPGGAA
jgi:hypothetical protein